MPACSCSGNDEAELSPWAILKGMGDDIWFKDAIVAAIKELVLPELAELKAGLATANQRLGGVGHH
ncbi:MAG: hypothetical protein PHU44_08680 [Syntrophales bacterium]|nr:hypothetical protein [Syntrophales bacterium]